MTNVPISNVLMPHEQKQESDFESDRAAHTLSEQSDRGVSVANVGRSERLASTLIGSALVLAGLKRGKLSGLLIGAIGGSLAYRGWSGHCYLYDSLGIDTAENDSTPGVPAQRGVNVEQSVVINCPSEELFAYWRDVENLSEVFDHVTRVESLDANRSRWTAAGPLGVWLQWEAEIFHEREGELIAWRSLPESQVETAGSVRFEQLSHDRGTSVTLSIKYNAPAVKLADRIASLFGAGAEQQISEDLRRFKQQMEAGAPSQV